jgi:hypothetical protein
MEARMFDPWAYEEKYLTTKTAESASQKALFQYCNMAANFGLNAADQKDSYTVKGYAAALLERTLPLQDSRIPQLKYLFAIHNQGHGDAIRGAMAAAEGLKKGVPDICLPMTIRSFQPSELLPENIRDVYLASGLYIELKRKQVLTEGKRKALIQARSSGRASTEQEDWQAFLRQQGYVCEICYGFEEARNLILNYLREGGLI